MVVDKVTGNAKGWMKEILYADDLVLLGESMDEFRENFDQWKIAFKSKGMKVILGKMKLMVSGIDEETPDSKVDPCGVCWKRVMANSVLCTICCKWILTKCTKMRKVTACLAKDFVCKNCKDKEKEMKEPVELLCDGVEGCEVAVTTRTRFGWMNFRECGELLKVKGFLSR